MRNVLGAIVVFSSIALVQPGGGGQALDAAVNAIQPSWIAPHVRFLSDSTLEGRDTASPGYQIGANYVAAQFELLGLKPAGDHGTFFQAVPIRKSAVAEGSASLEIESASGRRSLRYDREFLVHASGAEDGIDASGPLVFVGHSVSAPDYHYDDYASIDVRGKIAVFLPGLPGSLPPDVAAVYSRLGSRIQSAHDHGAVAVIEIAPGATVDNLRELTIRQQDATMWLDGSGHAHSIHFGGGYAMVTKEAVAAILSGQPHSIQEINAALKNGPFSFALNVKATLRARFEHHDTSTVNVAAVLPGRELPGEYVVYSAHLDHDGVSEYFQGDHVLHGALDNAGGVATILAAARAFTAIPSPRRSVLFLAVTGEEKGLVGSDYFVHQPTVPRQGILADINCDNFLWYGPIQDLTGVGVSYSTLDQDFSAAAARLHLGTSAAVTAVPGVLVLSDHYSFLEAGIPAVSLMNGERSGDGKRTGTQIWADYMRDIHHTPKDSIDQALDWSAAVTEARFAVVLGDEVADAAGRPRMKNTAFFTSPPPR